RHLLDFHEKIERSILAADSETLQVEAIIAAGHGTAVGGEHRFVPSLSDQVDDTRANVLDATKRIRNPSHRFSRERLEIFLALEDLVQGRLVAALLEIHVIHGMRSNVKTSAQQRTHLFGSQVLLRHWA